MILFRQYWNLRRHVKGKSRAGKSAKAKFQGNGTITGLDEALNLSVSNGKIVIVV
jgi:hypothetical protein